MDMNIGQVVSYGTYYDSEWTKLQVSLITPPSLLQRLIVT
jgi:hypothetical protein